MRYFDDDALAFLRDLKRHNDRTWFNEHKERYERSLRQPFLDFISDAGPELRTISPNLVADPRPSGGSLFRIHRDVRFSKDKSPYKTHAGAHFQLGGKGVHGPGYYLHLEPGECFVAGGMWMPEPEVLQAIRQRIADDPSEWNEGPWQARSLRGDAEAAATRVRRGSADDRGHQAQELHGVGPALGQAGHLDDLHGDVREGL